jgi:hypothetical protein
MLRSILQGIRQQWMGALALFLVLTGGTASALDGHNTVFSDDIVNGEVKTSDLAPGSVSAAKLADGSVTLSKIASGVLDACPGRMHLLGAGHDLCIQTTNEATGGNWSDAAAACRTAGFRLPSTAELLEAKSYLDTLNTVGKFYWSDDLDAVSMEEYTAWAYYPLWSSGGVSGGGFLGAVATSSNSASLTRCVATPSSA